MKKLLASLTALAAIGFLAAPAKAQMVNAQTGTTYTVANTDCDPSGAKLLTFNNAAAVAVTLPQAGASGLFVSGCRISVHNVGLGNVTITPTTSTINGASTLVVPSKASAVIFSDGTPAAPGNYYGTTGNPVFAGHAATTSATAPALTSCGTSPTIVGTDVAGLVTMGTGTPTGCVITFNNPYAGIPFCVVTWIATPLASQSYATSATAITLTQTATSSNVVQYVCIGRAGA